MSTKPWPDPRSVGPDGKPSTGCGFLDYFDRGESDTRCKHGVGECELCGTTAKRDALHATAGGVGVVGRLASRKTR